MDDCQAVQEAILDGRDKELMVLLESWSPGAVASPIDEEGTTLLHLAANTDNPRVLTALLDRGVQINARNGDGFTALHVAAMWGRDGSLKQLLTRGADPHILDNEEMTALDYTESEGHTQCADLLRNWSPLGVVSKENNPLSANSPCGSTSKQTSKTHTLSSPHLPPGGDDTANHSVAEAFVSLFLNMTQVAGDDDLTEVTQLSHLSESPSLMEILTPHKSPPHPSHPHSEHISTPHTEPYSDSEDTISYIDTSHPHSEHSITTPHIEPYSNSEDTVSYTYSPQTTPKSSCVRRLDLTSHPTSSEEERRGNRDTDEGNFDSSSEGDGEGSLLALDLKIKSCSDNEASSGEELFTTAIEPPPTSPPPSSPSPSSPAPFLADSLRKIQLRRQALQQRPPSLQPSVPTTNSSSALRSNNITSSTPSSKFCKNPNSSSLCDTARSPQPSTPTKSLTHLSSSSITASTTSSRKNPKTPTSSSTVTPRSSQPNKSSFPSPQSKPAGETQPYLRQPLKERLCLTPTAKSLSLSGSGSSAFPLTKDQHRATGRGKSKNPPHSLRAGATPNGRKHPPQEKERLCLSRNQPNAADREVKVAERAERSLIADSSFAAESTTQVPPRLQKLTNQELRGELLARGEQPGPVTDSTRGAYLVYLVKLEAGIQPAGNTGYKGYKYELALVLNGTAPIPDFSSLEQQVFHRFRASRLPGSPLRTLPSSAAFPLPLSLSRTPPTSPRSKRDWSTKTHFNYLLIDPTKLGGLCHSGGERTETLKHFRMFVEAVFYVGKGKNARSLQHLKDARDKVHLPQAKLSRKFSRILSIWRSGQGVVSLHVFHNTTAEEAFCREACMIDAIGLGILTNKQRGSVYGEMAGWGASRGRQFGVFLLHKAFLSYLLDPPQPVGIDDL